MDKFKTLKNKFFNEVNDWNNHLPLMWNAMQETRGDIIECGLGGGSTEQLHSYCEFNRRRLFSFEYDENWLKEFAHLENDTHKIHLIKDWDKMKDICPNPSVILIDHSPGTRRIVDIERFKDINGILVIHDTQPPPTAADYGYNQIWPLFKYKVDLEVEMNREVDPPHNRTWASAVSNVYDVTKWRGKETGNPDYKIV